MSKAFGFMGLIHSHAIKFFHDGGPYHIEISPLNCRVDDWLLDDGDVRNERFDDLIV